MRKHGALWYTNCGTGAPVDRYRAGPCWALYFGPEMRCATGSPRGGRPADPQDARVLLAGLAHATKLYLAKHAEGSYAVRIACNVCITEGTGSAS